MRTKAIPATLLSLLITLIASTTIARAADDVELEYDVTARVVRVSLIKGEVSVKRQGSSEWESAKVNLPLVEGDTIATGSDARAEIQIDARNFARLDSDSILKIVTLRDEGIALSLARGTAAVRLARFDRDREYFEIDAPKTTIAAERKGLYRVDVAPNGRVQVTIRDDGRARVYSETSGFVVRDGQTATLDFSASAEGDWQFTQALARDGWDDWVINREAYLAARLRYDDRVRYYDSDLWGAEELDAYGDWAYVNDYGWIWRPHVSVINSYSNWAPYRHGYWTWCPPYGWTWVGYEPWGWAPYHYGRWVYHNNYWAWCPRGPNHRRSWWRPALVAFVSFGFNFGSNYCWYPLPYHHRDPRSRHYGRDGRDGRDDRWRGMRPDELARLRRVDPAYFRAVTSQSAGQFGSQNARPQPASTELARRAVGMEPLRGDVPVRPAGTSDRSNAVAGDRQARSAIARPASVPAGLLERPTGAAARQPGVALDEELRRSRILNGRELIRPANPAAGGTSIGDSATGAVMRQARPARQPGMRDKEDGGTPADSSPVERTARPMAKPGSDIKGNDGVPVERPARPARDPGTRSNDGNSGGSSPVERPARPVRDPTTREKEPDRSNDAPPRRSEPAPRYEPPARSDPPPQRSEPAPRYEPPARSEPPPQRSEPAPRYDPPPQRSEPAPRYEPPARSDPPPQRSEPPARSDPPPQRSEPPARSDPPPQRSEPAPQRSEPTKPSEDRPPSRADRKNDG